MIRFKWVSFGLVVWTGFPEAGVQRFVWNREGGVRALASLHLLRDEGVNMFEIAWLEPSVIVTTIGQRAPDLAGGLADGE